MAFYIHKALGVIGSFAWSFGAISSSSSTESAAETTWAAGMVALFNNTGFNGLLPNTVTLTETSTSTASSDFKQTTKTSTTHAITGAATAAALPYQVAEVVTLRSSLATKYGHGRWFLPPLAVTAVASGGYILSSTAVADIVSAVDAAFSAFGSVLTLQVLHRKGSLNGAATPFSVSPIISGDVSNKFVIQKRRGDKFTVTRSAITA